MSPKTLLLLSQIATFCGFIGSLMMTPEFLGVSKLEAIREKLYQIINLFGNVLHLTFNKIKELDEEQPPLAKAANSKIITAGIGWNNVSPLIGIIVFLILVALGVMPFTWKELTSGGVLVDPAIFILAMGFLISGTLTLLIDIAAKVSDRLTNEAQFRRVLLLSGVLLLAIGFVLQFAVGCQQWSNISNSK